jgi:hypothetical protein
MSGNLVPDDLHVIITGRFVLRKLHQLLDHPSWSPQPSLLRSEEDDGKCSSYVHHSI